MVAMVVFGFGSGLLDVAPGAMLGDVVGSAGGTVIAAYQMAGDAGSLAGPLVAGALADSTGFGAAFASTALDPRRGGGGRGAGARDPGARTGPEQTPA